MKAHSTLCSIIAALTFSFSSPATAQEMLKPDSNPITHSSTTSTTAATNSVTPVKAEEPDNSQKSIPITVPFPTPELSLELLLTEEDKPEYFFPFGTDETKTSTITTQEIPLLFDSLVLMAPLDPLVWFFQKKEFTLDEPRLHFNPNPRHQDSSGIIQVRFELPYGISYNHLNKTFEMPPWSFKPRGKYLLYNDQNVRGYYFNQNYPLAEFFNKVQIGNFSVYGLLYQIRNQLPSLAEEQRLVANSLWDNISSIFETKKIETALTFGDFFRNILPQYTADGVVTPDELVQIQNATKKKVEEYYNTKLTPEEKKKIDTSVEQFTTVFNANNLRYPFMQNILSLFSEKNDPLAQIYITPTLNMRQLSEMFTSLKPLYSLTIGENSFAIKSDFYSRFLSSGNQFNTYFFQDHIFRHGFQSLSTGMGEAHLSITGEVHGGRPLRHFFDQKYASDFDTLELLLGYQPVFIDGTLEADINGFVRFKNFLIHGYEEIFPFHGRTIGIGFTQGYAYHFDANGKINLNAYSNSFDYSIGANLKGHLLLKESRGEHESVYIFSWEEEDSWWRYLSLGITEEQLNVREKWWGGNVNLKADLSGKYHYDYSWGKSTLFYRELNYTLHPSLRSGLSLNAGNPFFYLNNDGPGVGIAAIDPSFTFLAETQFPSFVLCDLLLAPGEKINTAAAKSYYRKTQLLADSLFPAKQALGIHEQHLYFSQLTGTFLEASWKFKNEQSFPHDSGTLFKTGVLMGKKDAFYSRFGYLGNFTTRRKGLYLSFGNTNIETQFSLQEENIPERQSSSTALNLSSRFNVGEVTFTAWAQLYAPALGHYVINREDTGDIMYNLTIEGPLDQIPITVHKGYTFFKELGLEFLRANWYIDKPKKEIETTTK